MDVPVETEVVQFDAAQLFGADRAGIAGIMLVLAVAFIVWILTVVLTGVSVRGWIWGYILPPVIIAIGWAVYAAIDDRVESHAGALYDRAAGNPVGSDATAPAVPSASADAGRRELKDGLTDEQRRMLEELG